jgi:PiT family inorganic phosphate transporter
VSSDIILVIVVGTALAFDFTNGFHDTANAVATSISTGALAPRTAVSLAALLNFVGAFISLEVAATVAGGIIDADLVNTTVVFAGLIGAISWNLLTWYYGLPSSSSHALIGGVVGAAFVAGGADAVFTDGLLSKVIVPAVVAPIVAFVAAGGAILITYRMVGRLRPGPVNRGYRLGQIASASDLAPGASPPTWVVVSAATAIALGTYSGGWRIIRTMGSRIFKMDPAQGFAAQSGGAAVLLTAAHLGFPLSTTHSITGAVLGAGAAKRLSAVRWGLAGNIVVAWVLTLPAAAAVGALTYGLSRIFGDGALGPLLISIALLALMAAIFGQRLRRGPALTTSPADT